MVGDVLSDRYELEALVGTGGMSSVFRAHDRLLDRKVALKILHDQYMADADYVERFRREARAVAALSHPNIVTVIDRGEHEGKQFIVFEYVAGENLKQLIQRRGPAPVATALELGIQIARGLSFAHQQGLVHRDVKPQNVLLNGNGEAKVTDFGIARSLDVQHGMTQTGTVLGTSDYIAPEQAQGQRVDEHTDVYSLGIVIYELLTSEVPFPGENFVAVAMRHINEPPPSVREKRPDVSPRLDAALQRAMAKQAEDRFATMADFCRELDACLQETQGTQVMAPLPRPKRGRAARVPVTGRRSRSPWPLLGVLGVLIVVGAVVAILLLRHTHNGSNPGTTGPGRVAAAPHLRAVDAYDPFGSPVGQEHNSEAPRATDHVASTYWETERYSSSLAAIGKPGVGLILDAGRVVQLHQIGVATSTPGFKAVIRAGDARAGPFTPVSPLTTVVDGTKFTIGNGAHRYYLLWITDLGGAFPSVHVNEVAAS
ncbi:MAG: serine/threonine protein kinase [Actinobacteria bacterium]|nr:serine/threonine protein kinase [Actinomycetota bacterium]